METNKLSSHIFDELTGRSIAPSAKVSFFSQMLPEDCQKEQDLWFAFLLTTNGPWHFYSVQRPILLKRFISFWGQMILFKAQRMNASILVGIFEPAHNVLINFPIFI